MDRSNYTDTDYRQPHVPPATPPAIDSHADAEDAATLPMDNGDSDAPGSRPAHFHRGGEDETLFDHGAQRHLEPGGGDQIDPSRQPDEIEPGEGDSDEPGRRPDEVAPGQGDFDQPDRSPIESPPQPDGAPIEAPPPD